MILKPPVSYPLWNNFDEQQDSHSEQKIESKRTDLWLALYFPKLALEILEPENNSLPFVVIEEKNGKQLVHTASDPAAQLGIVKGMSLSAARAFSMQLQTRNLEPQLQQRKLQDLASWALQFSSRVSLQSPSSLLIEVAASIKYFGSLRKIIEQIDHSLKNSCRHTHCFAITPSPEASLLLARSGNQKVIHDLADLRSVLGQVSVSVLPIDKKSLQQLNKIGVHILRDIWRLPAAALARRFSVELMTYLDRVLGKSTSILPLHHPPASFQASCDIPHSLEKYDLLLPYAERLLNDLYCFLINLDLYTNQFCVYFQHEKLIPTSVNITLRQALRDKKHFLMLLETRLQNKKIAAPVTGIIIIAKTLHSYTAKTTDLFSKQRTDKFNGENIDSLLEQLHARLGDDAIKSLFFSEDHRPEQANSYKKATQESTRILSNNRPFWLLSEPEQLIRKGSRLYYKSLIQFSTGPERIESGWWDGVDIRRDYYIGIDDIAGSLWIYHDLKGRRLWYLHGLFG